MTSDAFIIEHTDWAALFAKESACKVSPKYFYVAHSVA